MRLERNRLAGRRNEKCSTELFCFQGLLVASPLVISYTGLLVASLLVISFTGLLVASLLVIP
jgi:hypothetical protein